MRIHFIDREYSHTLVCMHGFMGSYSDFEFLDGPYNLLLCSIPGHDNTSVIELKDFHEKLKNAIKKYGISDYSILGYSMGGRISLQLLKIGELRPRCLIVESTALKDDSSDRLDRDIAIAERLLKTDQDKLLDFINEWYSMPLFAGIKDVEGFDQLVKTRLEQNFSLLANSLVEFSVAKQDLSNLKINCPLLYIFGEFDQKYALVARQFERLFSADVHMMLECSHNTHFMRKKLFKKVVDSFIEKSF